MDTISFYKMEIERAYAVLRTDQAAMQNARDIRGWLGCGFIKPLDAKALMEYNNKIEHDRIERGI